ncbi:P2-like signal transmitter [Methylophaga lonarensis MPL]|uniref:p2-like signal transmitter n=1 Tax=Methylophaga lonarensis MPL TaxID=1286106 RepID=M7NTF1_9GAMM|nr:P-II family nitrogen regulator [Methylophaga lonarensis]EMR12058.1 P2-like signal transmitter [Methylophaga lonarensis MPL]
MKMITAIIRPHALELVRTALSDLSISGLTVTEVKGYGRQKGHSEIYRGAEYTVSFQPKLKLEVVVSEDDASKTIDAITASANTGKIGDGKIFVSTLESVVRIRTSESGDAAI